MCTRMIKELSWLCICTCKWLMYCIISISIGSFPCTLNQSKPSHGTIFNQISRNWSCDHFKPLKVMQTVLNHFIIEQHANISNARKQKGDTRRGSGSTIAMQHLTMCHIVNQASEKTKHYYTVLNLLSNGIKIK